MLDRDCPNARWFQVKSAKTFNYRRENVRLLSWEEELARFCWNFWFTFFFVFVICVRADVFWAPPRGPPFYFFLVYCRWLAFFSVIVVSIDCTNSTELEKRLTATLLACTDVSALQLPVPRSPITTFWPDNRNPLDSHIFSTHRPPGLLQYRSTSRFGRCCVLSVCTARLAWTFTPHCTTWFPLRFGFLFLLCFVFSFSAPRWLVPPACWASRDRLSSD